jgi:hypothetical protein
MGDAGQWTGLRSPCKNITPVCVCTRALFVPVATATPGPARRLQWHRRLSMFASPCPPSPRRPRLLSRRRAGSFIREPSCPLAACTRRRRRRRRRRGRRRRFDHLMRNGDRGHRPVPRMCAATPSPPRAPPPIFVDDRESVGKRRDEAVHRARHRAPRRRREQFRGQIRRRPKRGGGTPPPISLHAKGRAEKRKQK